MSFDFKQFNAGTLFLVRTPDTFPVDYADKSFRDMKENLHLNFAALLETWNCMDGILWKSDLYPRSSYWSGCDRDPVEECFVAADKYGMTFMPEAGVMHDAYMYANREGMHTGFSGEPRRYGRMGLVPACPQTLSYFIEKYDALLGKFGNHPSCKAVCLPSETGVWLSYDKYTREAYYKEFGTTLPTPEEMRESETIQNQVFRFLEGLFLSMMEKLATHIRQKYKLPIMHYPLNKISAENLFQPMARIFSKNLSFITKNKEVDMLNMQLHPPLNPNPYFFKLETEYLMANANGIPCMADTHFYHECAAGRLPDTTPKRFVDSILSTLTPNGISFFCYGFMAEKLPLWKKELNPGAPVYQVYQEEYTVKARRKMCLESMQYVEGLKGMLSGTKHSADLAIYYPEELNYQPIDSSSYMMDTMEGLYELFNAATIPVKFIANIPEKATEQKAIILNAVRSLKDGEYEKLQKYIKDGGRVVVIGKCGDRIEKILGIEIVASNADCVIKPDVSDYFVPYFFRLPFDGKHYTEKKGEAILYYNDGTPAATRKGNVLFFGASDATARFGQCREFALAAWVREYFVQEGLSSDVNFTSKYLRRDNHHQFINCDIYENKSKKLLFIRNFGVEQTEASVHWNLPAGMKTVQAQADGKPFVFKNGETLPSFEHYVAICAEWEGAHV